MRRLAALLAPFALCAPCLGADGGGCAIALASTDAAGVATYTAECRWPVAPRFVSAIVGDPRAIAAASTSLAESTKLPDGRVLNVHSPGWPIDDRQSTLAIEKTLRPDGGLLLSYRLAPEQAPLGKGRVQARRDDGRWEIRASEGGGTLLRYETTFDAGGSLPVSLVQRTVRSSVAESLAELRAAAEANARAEQGGSSGS
ncbi:MAG TPA: hypothetical protein VII78_07335 [Myxococcota bacterium]|jgi:hypothetical protein